MGFWDLEDILQYKQIYLLLILSNCKMKPFFHELFFFSQLLTHVRVTKQPVKFSILEISFLIYVFIFKMSSFETEKVPLSNIFSVSVH